MRCTKNSFSHRARSLWRAETGAVTAEMALVMLIVSALMFGAVQIGRFVLLNYYLAESTYHAARYLALNPSDVDTARAMVRSEVERNLGSSIGEVELYVTSTRRDGQCLLMVTSKAHDSNMALNWLWSDPSAESAQVWPQASGCGANAAQPQPTATPSPTSIVAPSPTACRIAPSVIEQAEGTAMVNANLRLGPGFEYAIVGRLSRGEVVQVRGRDETATWLQVAPERIGWVYAPLIQLDDPVSGLRVVTGPPVPSSTSSPPPRMQFAAEPAVIRTGECATLRWNVAGAAFVTLNEENVSAHGERSVCPTRDAQYVLSAGFDGDRFYDRVVKLAVDSSKPNEAR